jgi:hypothetical protein
MLKIMLNREFVEKVLTRRNISQNGLARRLRISSDPASFHVPVQ